MIALFKPYPTASDYGLVLSIFLIQVELIKEAEHFAIALSATLFGLCMFPTMSAVWLTRNAGNANFLYNMTLVVCIFGGLTLVEWMRAGIKLRRRQNIHGFCHDIVTGMVESVLKG